MRMSLVLASLTPDDQQHPAPAVEAKPVRPRPQVRKPNRTPSRSLEQPKKHGQHTVAAPTAPARNVAQPLPPLASHKRASRKQSLVSFSNSQQGYVAKTQLNPLQLTQQIKSAQSADQVLECFALHSDQFDFINLSTAFHCLGKHAKKMRDEDRQGLCSSPSLKQLVSALLTFCSQFNAISISNIAQAQAILQFDEPRLMPLLMRQIVQLVQTHDAQIKDMSLAIICWAAARQSALTQEDWKQLSPTLIARLPTFDSQYISNVLLAAATVETYDESFLKAASAATLNSSSELDPRAVGNIANAYGLMGHYNPDVCNALARRAITIASKLQAQDIGRLYSAFAELEHVDSDLITSLAKRCIAIIPWLQPGELRNISWALLQALRSEAKSVNRVISEIALSGDGDRAHAIQALAIRSSHMLREASVPPHVLGQTLAAVAKHMADMYYYPLWLYDEAVTYFLQHEDSLNVKWWFLLLVAFKQAQYYCPEFMTALSRQGLRALACPSTASALTPQDIAGTVFSFAVLTVPHGCQTCRTFVSRLTEFATNNFDSFDGLGLVNMGWGLSALGYLNEAFFQNLQCSPLVDPSGLSCSRIMQLHQMQEVLKDEAPELAMDNARAETLKVLMQQAVGNVGDRPTSSFKQEVASIVESLTLPDELPIKGVEGSYVLPVALPSAKLAIEAATHQSFMYNQPEHSTGSSLLKWRLLQHQGWTVLVVPSRHWTCLNGVEVAQKAYMQMRLRQAADSQSGKSRPQVDESVVQWIQASLTDSDRQLVNQLAADALNEGLLFKRELAQGAA